MKNDVCPQRERKAGRFLLRKRLLRAFLTIIDELGLGISHSRPHFVFKYVDERGFVDRCLEGLMRV